MKLKEFLFEKAAVWKTIENWPNYEVSNTGLVRISKSGKLLKQVEHYGNDKKHPYMRVMLHSPEKRLHARVHRLVAAAFLGKPEAGKTEVDHLDGNTRNNASSNLEWVTPEENLRRKREREKKLKREANKRKSLVDAVKEKMPS